MVFEVEDGCGVGGEHGQCIGLGEAAFDGGVEVGPEVFAVAELAGGEGDFESGVMEPAGVGGGAFVVLEGGEIDRVGCADGEYIGGFGIAERDDDGVAHVFEGGQSAVGGAVVDDDEILMAELFGDVVSQEGFKLLVGFVEEGGVVWVDLIEA